MVEYNKNISIKSIINWFFKVRHRKSGPAFTMTIETPGGSVIDADLVPCLEFDSISLNDGYRSPNTSVMYTVYNF